MPETTLAQPLTVEVWHGGIPPGTPAPPAHTLRISDKPWSIPWELYVEHMARKPDRVVHVRAQKAGRS